MKSPITIYAIFSSDSVVCPLFSKVVIFGGMEKKFAVTLPFATY